MASFGRNMAAEAPAVGDSIKESALGETPAPEQDPSNKRFKRDQRQLQRDHQQKDMLSVLQQHHQVVPVGVKPLRITGAELDNSLIALGVYGRGPPVVQPGALKGGATPAGNPNPPG